MKLTLATGLFVSLLTMSCVHYQDCLEGINKLPMYGSVKKCPEQIEDDRLFLADCDKTFKSRHEATLHMVMRGWQYFNMRKLDTSMMRFNQAWLLDSLNAEVYWGFGNLLGIQKKFKESLPFFEKSVKIDPSNAKAFLDESTSLGNLFSETRDVKYLNASISCIKKAINLEPGNAQFYGQLTAAYTYFMQKDSARKYLLITKKLDPTAVNPEVEKLISNN